MKLTPYWYEDFSVEDFKDVLISTDEKKLNDFQLALSEEIDRRENAKAKSIELRQALQTVIENIEDEGFRVTYKGCPVIFDCFDVTPNF